MEDVEIQPLTKEDKIAHLVKIHVANYQKFVEAQKIKANQEVMMTSPEESERTTEAHIQERNGRMRERLESLGGKESIFSSDPQEA